MTTRIGTATRVARLAILTLLLGSGAAACAAEAEEDASASVDSAASAVTLHYLGSQSFLLACAGTTLGCGRRVSSVPDATPYISGPRHLGVACNEWITIRYRGKCVEAQRLETSDTNQLIEGNPGVFRALGIPHGDGQRCAGFGEARVTYERGRRCGESSGALTAACTAAGKCTADNGGCRLRCGLHEGKVCVSPSAATRTAQWAAAGSQAVTAACPSGVVD